MTRKMFLVSGLVLSLILFNVGPLFAQTKTDFVSVSLVRFNQTPQQLTVWVDEVGDVFKNRQMIIKNDHPKQKEFLAIMLTAMSLDLNLRIGVLGLGTGNDTITIMGTISQE